MTYYERHLPHWQPDGHDIFITWRLHGSLPAQFRTVHDEESAGKAFARYDRALDQARNGPLWLRDPRIAETVIGVLKNGCRQRYFQMHAYTVMANHVHVLLTPMVSLRQITHWVKGVTSRRANLILSRTGDRFWQDESFDHWVRNPAELRKIRAYIEQNPVKAGLVERPEEWFWSSASHPIAP